MGRPPFKRELANVHEGLFAAAAEDLRTYPVRTPRVGQYRCLKYSQISQLVESLSLKGRLITPAQVTKSPSRLQATTCGQVC